MDNKILKFFFLVLIVFALEQIASADQMLITNLSPANNSNQVCYDTKLYIAFDSVPTIATGGNLQICKLSDDSVIYQLNLQVLTNPPATSVSNPWPYQINLNGIIKNYVPFAVNGNILEIHPSVHLEYDTAYYIKITEGFCTSAGKTSPAVTDNTTWRFTTKAALPAADNDYLVSGDGTADFCTFQGAVDAVLDNDDTRTIIKIRNGTYRELINIPSSKINITWLGEDANTTIIAGYNRDALNPGSDYRSMVKCSADGFRMYNIKLLNTAGDNMGQAETIKHSGQKGMAFDCEFLSWQDTLLLNGQMYFKNCYIEGDTDFIWGSGTVYFDKCQMKCMSSGSYITQPRTPNGVNGFFMADCNFPAARGARNCYLGRMFSGYPYAQVVLLNCKMYSSVMYPVGWYLNDTAPENLRLWEYQSRDLATGSLINISNRLNPGSRQLSDTEAIHWRDVNNVFALNPWNPKTPQQPTASWLAFPADGTVNIDTAGITLTWAAGAGASSHIVNFGTENPPQQIIEQNTLSYHTEPLNINTTYYWRIDEKNSAGITTGPVLTFVTKPYDCPTPISWDLNDNCELDFADFAVFAQQWAIGEKNFNDFAELAIEWLSCNRNPSEQCWQ